MNVEWLSTHFASDAKVAVSDVAVRLVAAFWFGMAISGIYRITRGPRVARNSLIATLALLTVLIALTTVVIGDNVARAFSVVGALSIVRFRTVVEDTRDTAFVIFAVGVGLAVGAGYLVVPLIGLPIALVTAYIFHVIIDTGSVHLAPGHSCRLRVTVKDGFVNDGAVREVIERHSGRSALMAIGTAREGTGVRESYEVVLSDAATMRGVAVALLKIDGVLAADVERTP